MVKNSIIYKKMKFFYLVDKEDKSICDKCGSEIPASERLSVEGDTFKAAEFLIKGKNEVQDYILKKDLRQRIGGATLWT